MLWAIIKALFKSPADDASYRAFSASIWFSSIFWSLGEYNSVNSLKLLPDRIKALVNTNICSTSHLLRLHRLNLDVDL